MPYTIVVTKYWHLAVFNYDHEDMQSSVSFQWFTCMTAQSTSHISCRINLLILSNSVLIGLISWNNELFAKLCLWSLTIINTFLLSNCWTLSPIFNWHFPLKFSDFITNPSFVFSRIHCIYITGFIALYQYFCQFCNLILFARHFLKTFYP